MAANNTKKQVILLVDDEPEILDIYKTELEGAGYQVITAANGAEGLNCARKNRPDLVLMDFKMPVMDGIEAFTALKEDAKTKDIKVVFVSAFGDSNITDRDIKTAREIGALDFIKKGIDLAEFVAKVKSYIDAAA